MNCLWCGAELINRRSYTKYCNHSHSEMAFQKRNRRVTYARQAKYRGFPYKTVNRNLTLIQAAMIIEKEGILQA